MDTSKSGSLQISQGLEVLTPKSGKAYPVPCDEWNFLKDKLKSASSPPWILPAIAFLLLGAALTTFISLIIGGVNSGYHRIAWEVISGAVFIGTACLLLSNKQGRMNRTQVSEVVQQMTLIEKRFEGESTLPPAHSVPPEKHDLGSFAREVIQSLHNGKQ